MISLVCRCLSVFVFCGMIVTAWAGSLERGTWRPYANPAVLVTRGVTKGEMLIKAGNPWLTEVVSVGVARQPTVSVWTYSRTGHNASIATLTFRGKVLVRIATTIVQ